LLFGVIEAENFFGVIRQGHLRILVAEIQHKEEGGLLNDLQVLQNQMDDCHRLCGVFGNFVLTSKVDVETEAELLTMGKKYGEEEDSLMSLDSVSFICFCMGFYLVAEYC
jgi:hypothetical protein